MTGLNDIRHAIAKNREAVKMVMLTPRESQVFGFVRKQREAVRSSQITRRFKLSAQHTCMIMEALTRKGYVARTAEIQDSGGLEYEYLSIID